MTVVRARAGVYIRRSFIQASRSENVGGSFAVQDVSGIRPSATP